MIIKTTELKRSFEVGSETVEAIKGINLEVSAGEFLAITGPSGSGKTTLMNIIGCLDTPTSGEYFLNNKLVNELNENELAGIRNKEIGFVFQTFNLLPRSSSLENVALPLVYAGIAKEARTTRAIETLESVGLGNRMYHKPNELSGGQRQRIGIARALYKNPEVLVLDEATSSLDGETEASISDAIYALRGSTTVVLIAHRLSTIRNADLVVYLSNGKVLATGTFDQVRNSVPDFDHQARLMGL